MSYSGYSYFPGNTLTQYIYKSDGTVKEKEVDAIIHSNRPFKDDRCSYLKSLDEEHCQREEKRQKSDAEYYCRDKWVEKYYSKSEYEEIVEKMGDKVPKSLNSYIRMKFNNTSGFQKILKFAKENDIQIH